MRDAALEFAELMHGLTSRGVFLAMSDDVERRLAMEWFGLLRLRGDI